MTDQYDEIVDECRCERQGRCGVCRGTGIVVKLVKISSTNQQERESEVVLSSPAILSPKGVGTDG